MLYGPQQWKLEQVDGREVDRLQGRLGLLRPTARVLCRRGLIDPAAAQSFMEAAAGDVAPPGLLPDVDRACELTLTAVERNRPIWVHGDYDVDGLTATALVCRVLLRLGAAEVHPLIPNRLVDGYGLGADAVDRMASRGCRLLITVDCGTRAVEEVIRARARGIETVITDHHLPGEALPPAAACVNPRRPDSGYPFPHLAGVGVAYQFCRRLLELSGTGPDEEFEAGLLDLVACGTVADVVPLTGDNRALVRGGLELWRRGVARPGMSALAETARLALDRLSSTDIAYRIAPRLNAAGRLGRADAALELLQTTSIRRARELAGRLEVLNMERQRLERDILGQACRCVEALPGGRDRLLVVAGAGWHAGVVGIVAARLVERYDRPAIVISLPAEGEEGPAHGSGRGYPGFPLHETVSRCAGPLLRWGGHDQAVGLEMDPDRVDEFRRILNAGGDVGAGGRVLEVDDLLPLEDITPGLIRELRRLEPWGRDNPAPVFLAPQATVVRSERFGRRNDHLRLEVRDRSGGTASSLAFGWGEAPPPPPGSGLDLAFSLDEGRGDGKPTLRLHGVRPPRERKATEVVSAEAGAATDGPQGAIVHDARDHPEPAAYVAGLRAPRRVVLVLAADTEPLERAGFPVWRRGGTLAPTVACDYASLPEAAGVTSPDPDCPVPEGRILVGELHIVHWAPPLEAAVLARAAGGVAGLARVLEAGAVVHHLLYRRQAVRACLKSRQGRAPDRRRCAAVYRCLTAGPATVDELAARLPGLDRAAAAAALEVLTDLGVCAAGGDGRLRVAPRRDGGRPRVDLRRSPAYRRRREELARAARAAAWLTGAPGAAVAALAGGGTSPEASAAEGQLSE